MSTIAAVWSFTFESFLVKDDGVVLWCLRQAEKLTAETKRERNMKKRCIIHLMASKIFSFISSGWLGITDESPGRRRARIILLSAANAG